jgi:hypothetical protein
VEVVIPQAVSIADKLSKSEVKVYQLIFLKVSDVDLFRLAELVCEMLYSFLDCAGLFKGHV